MSNGNLDVLQKCHHDCHTAIVCMVLITVFLYKNYMICLLTFYRESTTSTSIVDKNNSFLAILYILRCLMVK